MWDGRDGGSNGACFGGGGGTLHYCRVSALFRNLVATIRGSDSNRPVAAALSTDKAMLRNCPGTRNEVPERKSDLCKGQPGLTLILTSAVLIRNGTVLVRFEKKDLAYAFIDINAQW